MSFTGSVLHKKEGHNHGEKGEQKGNGERRGQKPPKNVLYYLCKAQNGLEWQIVVIFLVQVINRFEGFHGWNRRHIIGIGFGL